MQRFVGGNDNVTSLAYPTCTRMQLKSISDKFEICSREQNLSWRHHYEVASIKKIGTDKNGKLALSDESDKEAMAKLLKQAETEKLSTRELADVVSQYKRRQQEEIRLANEPERYSLILADPAWEYDFSPRNRGLFSQKPRIIQCLNLVMWYN